MAIIFSTSLVTEKIDSQSRTFTIPYAMQGAGLMHLVAITVLKCIERDTSQFFLAFVINGAGRARLPQTGIIRPCAFVWCEQAASAN